MDRSTERVPVRFYSVLVLENALALRGAACEAAFNERYPTADRAAGLRVVVSMSGGELEEILAELEAMGLRAGQDFAVGEMVHGEEIACPGICFAAELGYQMPRWFAWAAVR